MYSIIKILMSALIIAGVTEMAKRFPAYGGIVAALPIVSLLSIVWLSVQGEKREVISQFTLGVLYGLPGTILLLAVVYICLKNSLHLFMSLSIGVVCWGLFLGLQKILFKIITT
ncbi:DUF3147 family protein [Priestia aryabhattai]|jgi:hypothetical protein|uniref:DUF3147 family protein n=1 Tax=Priestia TaxID=2800373 RepID=UPI00070BBC33|nr:MULTISPECIES: DUF3147 family protein [Priestia]KRD93192.1 hypothetical protein ASE46_19445 [Bacillus sp. Root239]MBU3569108.1 DUF3147 family protein [Priestia aryabhattai]MBU8688805.1 DUF3147 family protein [Priestia megaterium]MCM3541563.1 DUF3147 family protein [Priestia megaterium]MDI3092976.1 DUF3147 family protein [Priestia megaterium]